MDIIRLKTTNFVVAMLYTITLSACIEKDSDNPIPADIGDLSPPEAATSLLSGEQSSVKIDGKWINNPCGELKPEFPPYQEMRHFTRNFEFSGNKVFLIIDWFPDKSCTTPRVSPEYVGTLTFGKELTTSSALTVQEMDIQFDTGALWKALVTEIGGQVLLNFGTFTRVNDVQGGLILNPTEAPEPQRISNIDGVWESPCFKGPKTFFIETDHFSGDRFTLNQAKYSDSSCSQLTGEGASLNGSLILGNEVTTPSGIEAKEMTMTYDDGAGERKGLVARSGNKLVFQYGIDSSPQSSDVVTPLVEGESRITLSPTSQ
jgi:hypothetical protein